MNKLTKMGVSALCGSLAAISAANAGEMTVTGGADMSWVSLADQNTGNPIGMGSNLSFTGSGELDNGWGVALGVYMDNKDAYSQTTVTVTVPSLGAIQIDQGVTGTGLDRIDDVTPNVWEEAWGTAVGTGIDTVSGVAGGSNIEYTPNMLPAGLTGRIAYSPKVNGSSANDKGSAGAGAASAKQSGYDITLVATDEILGMPGLTLYAGQSKTEQTTDAAAINGDIEERTFAVKYAAGGFTVGYQWSEEDMGRASDPKEYENDAYGITFNINDDLSVGYNNYESKQVSATSTTAEAQTLQVAYSMGGASIRLAETQADNVAYQTAAGYDRDGRTLSVSLAF
jgi:outer membrane protein OmpU